ncbi:uncharacterized protein Z518_08432 [Rhinocladiella mackenziei CBS 650.93]|uniref:Zn(2)-C6 fungal-type domain-containing protein n=1 Tax=Rhinocladiella mackenziei CBS 650.93 TaxID=1442369 RepID=A0A0D2IGU2_9EURO|nr:uncharacterized protein Z518_08432 [Rhinocladiella mackenziei CBS 650.93]KIX02491.1 hypothetical protein Z518_08432 [Rhinocladiella mackenziei CBS 650.93]
MQVGDSTLSLCYYILTLIQSPRIRRVKCDETKPHCRKCTELGRKCEGPVANQIRFVREQPARPKAPTLQTELSLLAPQHPDDERHAFDYFTHRAAPIFAGAIDASFWIDLVPRLAQSSSCVWNTVVSISWLFEHVPYQSLVTTFEYRNPMTSITPHHGRALKWYSRAIADLRQRIEQGQMDTANALLSCVLFASVEFQQRNIGNALILMKSGYRILAQSLSTAATKRASSTTLAIHEVVTPLFSRHAVLMATLGTPIPPGWSYHAENILEPSILSSLAVLDNVRTQLYNLMYQSYEIIRVAILLSHDDYEMEKIQPQKNSLLQELHQWRTSFMERWGGDKRMEIAWVSSNLLMYWGVSYIWLATCTSRFQTAFDEHIERFAEIIFHAQKALYYSAESATGQPVLSFEIGVMPPLYFSATKCRDPLLRRKALHLMRQAPAGESLWASVAPTSVIEKVISIEEGHDFTYRSESPSSLESVSRNLPPEKQRIHHVAVIRKELIGGSQRLAAQLTKMSLWALWFKGDVS